MGVLKPCHRKGYGRALVDAAVAYARQTGYEFMQVKTVQMGKYEEYDRTNQFNSISAVASRSLRFFPRFGTSGTPARYTFFL